MESKQFSLSKLEQDGSMMTVVDRRGNFVDVTEEAADLLRYDQDELIGSSSFDLICKDNPEDIKEFSTLLDGSVNKWTSRVKLGDGTKADVSFIGQKVLCEDCGCCEDSDCLVSEIQEVNVLKDNDNPASKQVGEGNFNDLTARELQEIAQNIRVDAPDGKIPLNAIMFDLMVDHNEIEQVKKGALSLHEACDERLAEEQETNPDSPEVDVLREISESAYGLYLRIQRGDAELQGERDGEYSGYWNS